MEVVVFVPGFFGFGAFGHPDRPLVEYFARVEDALLRAHVRPLRFAVHQPPPAGSLAERVRSLHDKIVQLIANGAGKAPFFVAKKDALNQIPRDCRTIHWDKVF